MRACPVCPYSDIDDADARCPSCGADLAPLNSLAALPESFLQSAHGHLAAGRADEACLDAAAAVALHPAATQPRVLYGQALWNAGQFRAAREQLLLAAARSPDDPGAATALSTVEQWLRGRRRTRIAAASACAILLLGYFVLLPRVLYPDLHEQQQKLGTAAAMLAQIGRENDRISRAFAEYRSQHAHSNGERDSVEALLARYRSFAGDAVNRVAMLHPGREARASREDQAFLEKLRSQCGDYETRANVGREPDSAGVANGCAWCYGRVRDRWSVRAREGEAAAMRWARVAQDLRRAVASLDAVRRTSRSAR